MRNFISMMWAKWMLAGCLSLFLFSACDKEDGPAVGPAERVVLVYFAADNSLSNLCYKDLDEIRAGMLNISDSMLLFAYVDAKEENAKLLKFRNIGGKVSEEIVKEYGVRNSVGVEETQEVFNDVFGNPAYQADSYGLIYWSHGDGWIPYSQPSNRWIGQDTGNEEDNRMNLSDFKEILATAPHLDFLMFDACFMQSIEVAYELRDYADYVIASPTETPGPGAPYDAIMPYLAQVGASAAMAGAYFEAYNALYNGSTPTNDNWTGGVSICVLRTNGLESLAALTAQLMPTEEVDLHALRKEVFDYDQRSGWDKKYYIGYHDWAQMMQALLSEADYTTWRQAYDDAVVYWNTTPKNYSAVVGMFSMEGTNGVTHYIPQSVTSPRAESYRSLDWYTAAGLAKLGW